MNIENFKNLTFSVFGKETEITGDLIIQGDTIIAGKVHGNIVCKGHHQVILEQTAEIDGDISCHNLEVFGKLSGSINASGVLAIRSSANVSGSILAKKMSIYPGAIHKIQRNTDPNLS